MAVRHAKDLAESADYENITLHSGAASLLLPSSGPWIFSLWNTMWNWPGRNENGKCIVEGCVMSDIISMLL